MGLKLTAVILAYLIGSIPTSVWLGRYFFHTDVREHGSGNAGFTNALRVLGPKVGIPVLAFDVFKGWAAVNLVNLFGLYIQGSPDFIKFQLLLGLIAVIGHIFPVYVGFKGGKGVATILGVVLAIHPLATLIAISVFIVTLLISKYVSLSSLVAGISYPVILVVVFKTTSSILLIFAIIVAILLLITHQKNIERLLRNEENKAGFLTRSTRNRD